MRRSLLALFVVVASVGVLAGHASAVPAGEIDVWYGPAGTHLLDGGTLNLGTTTSGQDFEVYIVVGNNGPDPSSVDIASVTVPAGITVTQALPANIFAGASWGLGLQCDGTASVNATLTIVSNDADEGNYDINVVCNVVAPGGTPVQAITDRNGIPISNGTVYEIEPGAGQLFWIRNTGTNAPLLVGLHSEDPGVSVNGYIPDNVVAAGGLPVYFTVQCASGSSPVSNSVTIGGQGAVSDFTFTVLCTPGADNSDLVPTGSGLTLWASALAALLLLAGAGLWLTSRRAVA